MFVALTTDSTAKYKLIVTQCLKTDITSVSSILGDQHPPLKHRSLSQSTTERRAGNRFNERNKRSNLKFIRHVLLVERIEADELETLRHNVEGLVVSFGAQSHLICSDLQRQQI